MRVCAVNGTSSRRASVALAEAEPLLREHDDRAALGRLVGEARELRRVGQLAPRVTPGRGIELRRLAVAERDRAGLVEQQRVDSRPPPRPRARTSRARCAARAGPSRRCRSPRAARRSSSGSGTRAARRARSIDCSRARVDRERLQRDDASRKMIVSPASRMLSAISLASSAGSAPSTSAIMRSRNVSPGLRRDPHDDLVGEHPRAAGDSRAVAAGLADHGRRLAGDRRLVDRGDALDRLAVAGDQLAGGDDDDVADAASVDARHLLDRAVGEPPAARASRRGSCAASRPAPCRALRPSPRRSWRTAR